MFEVVFIRRNALEKHRSTPLREERERFLNYLQGQGYSRQQLVTLANSLLHIVNAIGLTSMRPVSEAEIMQAAEQWAGDTENHLTCPPGPGTVKVFRKCALRWFKFCHSLIPREVVAPLCEDFVLAFNRGETDRGVSGETIRSYSVRVRYFLDWYLARFDSFASVRSSHVLGYLDEKREEGWNVRTRATQCQALRSFFRHAEGQRWCFPGIARSIKSPRIPKYEEAPRVPACRDVRRLIRLTRTDNTADRRALPLLLLCAIYGLRATEIANLRLDDIDWRNETITIRRAKRGRTQQFPLQYEVGEAIINYLQHARPRCASRHLFVTRLRPFRPLSRGAAWVIIGRRMRKHGVRSSNVGPHALRHACATQLLRKGSSLRGIADFLGHKDIKAVSIYARHDPRMLRKVAAFSLGGIL
jgi:site-specific recombinase XerD